VRRIFFCYNSDRDRLFVNRLRKAIQDQFGWEVVDSSTDSYTGEQFSTTRSLIQKSSLAICVLSTIGPNTLLETGIALGLGKQTLVLASLESLPSTLRSLPYVALSGDIEFDVAAVTRRLESFQVEEEHPRKAYNSTIDQLRSYKDDPVYFESLSPAEFEELVVRWFEEHGYSISRPDTPHDLGIDAMATSLSDSSIVVIQSKKFTKQSRVSMRDVMALLGAATLVKANDAVLVTSSSFTPASLEMAATTRNPKLHLLTVEDLLRAHDKNDLLR
jgi:restriction endonuclease Mrr